MSHVKLEEDAEAASDVYEEEEVMENSEEIRSKGSQVKALDDVKRDEGDGPKFNVVERDVRDDDREIYSSGEEPAIDIDLPPMTRVVYKPGKFPKRFFESAVTFSVVDGCYILCAIFAILINIGWMVFAFISLESAILLPASLMMLSLGCAGLGMIKFVRGRNFTLIWIPCTFLADILLVTFLILHFVERIHDWWPPALSIFFDVFWTVWILGVIVISLFLSVCLYARTQMLKRVVTE